MTVRLWSSASQIFSLSKWLFWPDLAPAGVRFYLTVEFGGKLWALFQTRCLEIPSVKEVLLHLSRRETLVKFLLNGQRQSIFTGNRQENGGRGCLFGCLRNLTTIAGEYKVLIASNAKKRKLQLKFLKLLWGQNVFWSHEKFAENLGPSFLSLPIGLQLRQNRIYTEQTWLVFLS